MVNKGPQPRQCHFDLVLWPIEHKIYRYLYFFILYLCLKYGVSMLKQFWVQQTVDRQMDMDWWTKWLW